MLHRCCALHQRRSSILQCESPSRQRRYPLRQRRPTILQRRSTLLQRCSPLLQHRSPLLKGHLLVIPLLFKGKTKQNLGTSMLSYELILSNIFIEMSFIVLCG